MNMKTVEGLVGARTNINLSDTAMGVFRQATRKGDTATAERALGYAGDMVEQAEAYESKAEDGMKADARELKEKAEAELEKLIEKRREDHEKLEDRMEQNRKPDGDTIEISEDGKAAAANAAASAAAGSDSAASVADAAEMPAVIYSSTGEALAQETPAKTDISVVI